MQQNRRKVDLSELIQDTKSVVFRAIKRHLSPEFHYAIDDVVQETYIRAARTLQKGDTDVTQKINGWLYTIAKNESLRMNEVCRKELRKKQMLKEAEQRRENKEDSVLSELKDSLSQLPVIYQEVMRLSLQGYRIREIGDMLGISPGTVKSRSSRAREMLYRIYNNQEK